MSDLERPDLTGQVAIVTGASRGVTSPRVGPTESRREA
jgi:hypothetical protein